MERKLFWVKVFNVGMWSAICGVVIAMISLMLLYVHGKPHWLTFVGLGLGVIGLTISGIANKVMRNALTHS